MLSIVWIYDTFHWHCFWSHKKAAFGSEQQDNRIANFDVIRDFHCVQLKRFNEFCCCTFCSLQQEFFSVLWTKKRIEYSLDVNGSYCAVFACGYRCFIELTQKKLVFMERFYSRIFETKTKSRYIENNLRGCKLRSRQIKITVNNEKRNICYSNVEVPTIPVTLLSSLRISMCDFMALWIMIVIWNLATKTGKHGNRIREQHHS